MSPPAMTLFDAEFFIPFAVPATGGVCVLWDGNGLVVKRVEAMHGNGAPRLRLLSANPDYAPYARLAEEVHIVGKVIWTVRKV